ncbi:hypothetical protein A0J48_007020 [Sphaerospermopsis aphanizomenoides BCCUSP55]|uniref:hypothetical protein n=1 Tax=Sphaerospermopsis aphanizomenoides TaxID=459663 RepID=UPI001905AAA6|nr:hypothetical protein [Sphaerospermopsis aphanizomenoides]MBK1987288.1 hypothetical protein [Sphaerospermopsis aphanizomenoides BCCUSP55]
MAEPLLTDVFGDAASQTTSNLSVNKADFTTLTPSATNTAESMAVAILLRWEQSLTPEAQNSNPDQSLRVERGTEAVVSVFNADNTVSQFKEFPFTITLRQPYVAPTIDPNQF